MLTDHQKNELESKGIDWTRIDAVPGIFAVMAAARGKGIIVDTRRPEQYETRNFPGAVNLRGEEELLTLPRDKAIFLYCT